MTARPASLAEWLAAAGLDALEPTLLAADIDLDVLGELSDDDLKEIGLTLGQRRRLLRAISSDDALPAQAGEAGQAGADRPAPDQPAADPAPEGGAERRRVTVMFVDMVGSTALAANCDPEEMADTIARFQDAVSGVVARLGGYVAKFMGDGVLIYFGWPRVREDEVQIALRAGLQVLQAVGRLKGPGGADLSARIGCASGWVVIGDLIGEAEARERTVVGATPNLAARLQTVAQPGEMVVAESTHRLISRRFRSRALPPLSLKGYDEPVVAFAISEERAAATRLDAMSEDARRRPLVGRDHELALLLQSWRKAARGAGACVLLLGEPGIGKSRIAIELLERAHEVKHRRMQFQCSPHYADTPLWPISQQVRRAAGLDGSERLTEAAPEVVEAQASRAAQLAPAERLAALATIGDDTGHALAVLAELAGVEAPGAAAFRALPSTRRRALTQRVLIDQVLGLAKTGPVLMILEDAHWADPSTLELFELLAEATAQEPVMTLMTSRLEDAPRLSAPNVTQLTLNRLEHEAVQSLISNIANHFVAPPDVVTEIVRRCDGVPLYAEELTKAVLEERQDAFGQAGAIPASLHDSLMARLDRLPGVREVAQVAACIGREFSRSMLLETGALAADRVDAALAQLVEAELVFRRGRVEEETFIFKHALVRDAAYASLLSSRRKEIFSALVSTLDRRGAAAPALLGQYAAEAGDAARAVAAFAKAGEEAARRSANEEAVRAIRRALDLAKSLPEAAREERRLELQAALSVPLIAARGYASPEVEELLGDALARAERLGSQALRFKLTRGLWNCVFDRGELERSHTLAEALVALADASGQGDSLRLAYRALGSNLMNEGRLAEARLALERVLSVEADWSRDATLFEHGEDPEMIARFYRAWITTVEGDVDDGLMQIESAVRDAIALPLPIAGVFARTICSHIHYLRRDFAACNEISMAGLAISEEYAMPFWAAALRLYAGWSGVFLGGGAECLERAKAGLAGWRATGARLHVSTWSAVVADAALHLGKIEEAAARLDDALAFAKATGEAFMIADIVRLNAKRLMAEGRDAEAEAALRESHAISERQGACWLQLRAALDLARLQQRRAGDAQGDGDADGLDLLAAAHHAIREGAETADRREAADLLRSAGRLER